MARFGLLPEHHPTGSMNRHWIFAMAMNGSFLAVLRTIAAPPAIRHLTLIQLRRQSRRVA